MNDRELAEKVVALGVGQPKNLNHTHFVLPYLKHHDHESSEIVPLDEFVRDWRVAGALMEKMLTTYDDLTIEQQFLGEEFSAFVMAWVGVAGGADKDHIVRNDSLPRAIIESCVLALEGESE